MFISQCLPSKHVHFWEQLRGFAFVVTPLTSLGSQSVHVIVFLQTYPLCPQNAISFFTVGSYLRCQNVFVWVDQYCVCPPIMALLGLCRLQLTDTVDGCCMDHLLFKVQPEPPSTYIKLFICSFTTLNAWVGCSRLLLNIMFKGILIVHVAIFLPCLPTSKHVNGSSTLVVMFLMSHVERLLSFLRMF